MLQDWPISGGERQETRKCRDLLLTGHEDGSVKFWNVSTVSMQLLYKVNTASYFEEGFTEQGMSLGDGKRSGVYKALLESWKHF